ncbi:unnamed protein product [Ostreobium quekettii]|uniref:F-box domain-containing protein n=1 Tax=Ostreobium quekettii TaxID=121088 RepID=A0A8S1J503_9CHLO|nr:unnamed protein product [Ostreobium quekettii]
MAGGAGQGQWLCLPDLPLPAVDMATGFLSIADLARCSCVSKSMRRLCQDALEGRRYVSTRDVTSTSTTKTLSALRLVAHSCKRLCELDVRLPPRGWASSVVLEPLLLLSCWAVHLRRLVLVNVDVTNDSLCLLATSAQGLEHLELGSTEQDVPNTSVGDEGVTKFARMCTNLESAAFLHCYHVGDKAVRAIARYQQKLKSLRLCACPEVSKMGIIAAAQGCTNLEVLDLVAVRHFRFHALVDEQVASALGSCTKKLREIRLCEEALGASLLDDFCLKPLVAGCKSLEVVEMHGADVSDNALIMIGENCPKLRVLVLKNTWATYRGIDAIARGCPLLEGLTINGCWIRTNGAAPDPMVGSWAASLVAASGVFPPAMAAIASQFPRLTYLALSDLETNPVASLGALAASPFLHRLRLLSLRWSMLCEPVTPGSAFDGTMRGVLEAAGGLEALDLAGYPGDMDGALLSACAAARGLKTLDIPYTSVTEAGLQSLATSGLKLVGLNLSCCNRISGGGLSAILTAMGNSLKDLNLYGLSGITDSTVSELLGLCPNLMYLNVGGGPAGNGITREGLKELQRAGNMRALEVDVLPRRGYRRAQELFHSSLF